MGGTLIRRRGPFLRHKRLVIGNALYRCDHATRKRWLLALGICLNVGILVYFKYAGFFVDNLNDLLIRSNLNPLPALTIALPIGVSFIVFKKITYLVDIYRGLGPPASSITSYLLYVLLFPKLLAGPIVKYHTFHSPLGYANTSISYIPLGGNRVPPWRVYCNLWLCFVLCGLWHGASWTFVLWGMFHGALLIIDKVWWIDAQKHLPRSFNVSVTFLLVMFGWVIFRAESIEQIWFYLWTLLGQTSSDGTFMYLGNNVKAAMAAGLLICFLPATPWLEPIHHHRQTQSAV